MHFGGRGGEEDGSSGEDVTPPAATAPPSSSRGGRKRTRKATGDAIVEAMLEIAAATKMRAAAIMKSEDRFSISKCIKLLDDMQEGLDQRVYLFALDLFENPNAREIFVSLKSERRLPWLTAKSGV